MKVVNSNKLYPASKSELNDCSVQALATTFEIHYDKALWMLFCAGREFDEGFQIYEFFEHCAFKGFNCVEHKFVGRHPTLKSFAEKNTTGSYLVYMVRDEQGHVVAVKNGVIYDSGVVEEQDYWCNTRIFTAWKVEKEK